MLLPLDWVLWLRIGLSLPCGATVAPCGHATGPACQADEVADRQMGAGLLQVTGDLEEGQAANTQQQAMAKAGQVCCRLSPVYLCLFSRASPALAGLAPSSRHCLLSCSLQEQPS